MRSFPLADGGTARGQKHEKTKSKTLNNHLPLKQGSVRLEILQKHLQDKIDEDTIEYMQNIIVEENCQTSDALFENIGDFLIDENVVENEDDGKSFCEKIILYV